MGMTNKEKTLDWLYRLRSEIYVYMPKEWLIPMDKALDVAIDTVKREEMLEDWTKKCRKFEADYENRLKADMVAMLTEIQLEIEEKEYLDGEEPINITQDYIDEVKSWEYGKKDCYNIIQQKIDKLKEVSEPQESSEKQ